MSSKPILYFFASILVIFITPNYSLSFFPSLLNSPSSSDYCFNNQIKSYFSLLGTYWWQWVANRIQDSERERILGSSSPWAPYWYLPTVPVHCPHVLGGPKSRFKNNLRIFLKWKPSNVDCLVQRLVSNRQSLKDNLYP